MRFIPNLKISKFALSKRMEEILNQKFFRHYKGGTYEVKHIGFNTTTEVPQVVYEDIRKTIWIRDFNEFISHVYIHDREMWEKRFVPCNPWCHKKSNI